MKNSLKITVDLPEGVHTSYYDSDMIDEIDWQEEVIRIKELIYAGNEVVNYF